MKLIKLFEKNERALMLRVQQGLESSLSPLVEHVKLKPAEPIKHHHDYGYTFHCVGPLTDFMVDVLFRKDVISQQHDMFIEGRTERDPVGVGLRLLFVVHNAWTSPAFLSDPAGEIIKSLTVMPPEVLAFSYTYDCFFFHGIVKHLPAGWEPFYKNFKLTQEELFYARLDNSERNLACGMSMSVVDGGYELKVNNIPVRSPEDLHRVLRELDAPTGHAAETASWWRQRRTLANHD